MHDTYKSFPGDSVVKNLPAMPELQETWVRSLGQEDPLEEVMATYFSILAWRVPRTEEPDGLQSIGLQRVRHNGSDFACMHARYVKTIHMILRTDHFHIKYSTLIQGHIHISA